MTVLDMGCGPGVFAIEMAKMVGKSGHVIACDLQEGMLQKLKGKISGTAYEERVTLCKSEENDIGFHEPVDFILAFYIVHEVIDQERFLKQLSSILRPNGLFLVVEPPLHVSKAEFAETTRIAQDTGLVPVKNPKVFLSKTMLLRKD